jgi:hypothetical protein
LGFCQMHYLICSFLLFYMNEWIMASCTGRCYPVSGLNNILMSFLQDLSYESPFPSWSYIMWRLFKLSLECELVFL